MTGMVPADKHKTDPQDVTECRRKAIEAEQEYRALFKIGFLIRFLRQRIAIRGQALVCQSVMASLRNTTEH
ncbi:MAG: hypothetical protein SCM11_16690 [Bacillota bacterium]|nr:hypothetical protein [Bacillota bacterium]